LDENKEGRMNMTRSHIGRSAGLRRRILIVAMAVMAPLAIVSTASATEHHPKGNFAPFAQCPLSNPEVELCTVANTTSGEFTVGKKTVPINKTITLQGGLHENSAGELEFYAAENGETLSKTALYVPGGLFGTLPPESWPKEAKEKFEEMVNKGLTGVTETTEIAGPVSGIKLNTTNLIFEKGVALQLPVKIKVGNFLVGNSCYVGSNAHPIILNLTTGETSPKEPNKPIHGAAGELEILEGGALVRLSGGSLVDNAFAVEEGANGCGAPFSFLVDKLVNEILGVPSGAGHNTAILNGKLEEALAAAVKASE
jgi:hypothetical protein